MAQTRALIDLTPPQSERVSAPPTKLYSDRLKRMLDVVLVLLGLPFVVPLLLVCVMIIGLRGGAPFFVQERIGRGGHTFRLWKLRTMVPDAERQLERHLAQDPKARDEWETKQKLTHDPRITRVGRFLRRASLDELPQVFNVLKGDMSLVGPRPMMVNQRHLYPGQAYFHLRPGITGPWQVSARNQTTFAARARYDADYLQRVSLREDLWLILQTFQVVLRATGN